MTDQFMSIYVYIISYYISYLQALAYVAQLVLAKNKKNEQTLPIAAHPWRQHGGTSDLSNCKGKIRGPDAIYNERQVDKGSWRQDLGCRISFGTWNVTSLVGKESEVQEVKWYQLDIDGLTSRHSSGSGNKHLDRGWSSSFSAVGQDESHLEGVGILSSWLCTMVIMNFNSVDKWGISLWFMSQREIFWLCSVLMCQTTVQSVQLFWRPWVGPWNEYQLGTA